jgi:30S ribosomal protein S31
MGKGDKKSKKGKIFMGSFGNSRLKKGNAGTAAVTAAAAPKKEKKVEKKAKKA